jgi:hypothetical protein
MNNATLVSRWFWYAALALLAAILFAPLAHAASLSPAARLEIDTLLWKMQQSECAFNRNGTWYSADAAQAHLKRKLAYLVERDAVASAEQFIARAASKSSMSGERYQVRCGDHPPVPSRTWLEQELAKIRATPR